MSLFAFQCKMIWMQIQEQKYLWKYVINYFFVCFFLNGNVSLKMQVIFTAALPVLVNFSHDQWRNIWNENNFVYWRPTCRVCWPACRCPCSRSWWCRHSRRSRSFRWAEPVSCRHPDCWGTSERINNYSTHYFSRMKCCQWSNILINSALNNVNRQSYWSNLNLN